jgi:hypothetical protein
MTTSTTICFFDNSYQVERIVTDRNVTESFIIYKLGELNAHRPADTYWASVDGQDGTTHHTFKNGTLCANRLAR